MHSACLYSDANHQAAFRVTAWEPTQDGLQLLFSPQSGFSATGSQGQLGRGNHVSIRRPPTHGKLGLPTSLPSPRLRMKVPSFYFPLEQGLSVLWEGSGLPTVLAHPALLINSFADFLGRTIYRPPLAFLPPGMSSCDLDLPGMPERHPSQ